MPACSIPSPSEFTGLPFYGTNGFPDPLYTRGTRGIALQPVTVALVFLAAGVLAAEDLSGKLELTNTPFRPGSTIPTQFTCSGANIRLLCPGIMPRPAPKASC